MEQRNQGFGPPPAGGFGAPGASGPGAAPPGPFEPPFSGFPPGRDGLAVGSLIAGILAIPGSCCCFTSVPLGAAALAMGLVALKRHKSSPHVYGGRTQALAGVICGSFALALTIINVLFGLAGSIAETFFNNVPSAGH